MKAFKKSTDPSRMHELNHFTQDHSHENVSAYEIALSDDYMHVD